MAGLIQEAEFTEDAVRQIKRLMQSGLTAEEIAARAFSLLIEMDVPDGPETIGWDLDRINDFLYRPSPRSSGGFPSHRVSRDNRKSAQSRRREYGRGRSRSG
jgi:hypothetical protein